MKYSCRRIYTRECGLKWKSQKKPPIDADNHLTEKKNPKGCIFGPSLMGSCDLLSLQPSQDFSQSNDSLAKMLCVDTIN